LSSHHVPQQKIWDTLPRVDRLRRLLAERALAGILISQPENRRYLSGFTGSAGVLLITADRQAIATDARYYEQVGLQCLGWELFRVGYEFDSQLPDVLRQLGLEGGRLGFEASHVSVERYERWQAALDGRATLQPTTGLVESLRQRKDEDELQAIRRAVALADQAMAHLYEWLRPGVSERQVAWELESTMRTRGAEAVAFEIIVAAGPHAALPHIRPTERGLERGEPVIVDFGCVVDGYCCDITRTLCLGQPRDGRYLELWELVRRAQEAAIAGLRAGMSGAEADDLARRVIVAAGYGEYFGHSLGHGVGLAVQEEPRLSYKNPEPLQAGAVVTVEPGIYLPGWGGVRHEDMLVLGEDGAKVLTRAAKLAVI